MCTVLLLPADNPIAINKYIISYHMGLSQQEVDFKPRTDKYTY
jgi:hypothetical protein